MLSKKNRLAKDRDIQTAFARGRNFFSQFFNLKFFRKDGPKRFAVVVSTKVFKNAVARNRLKRVIRENLRKSLSKFPGGDYMVMAKPRVAHIPEPEAIKNLMELVGKVR